MIIFAPHFHETWFKLGGAAGFVHVMVEILTNVFIINILRRSLLK
jgi:hypothetical protein